MANLIVIGLVAGLVSALLFSVAVTGSPPGVLLSYAAPLPILITALGWNHRAGLVGALSGAVVVGIALRPTAGLAYAVASGFPAWWIGFLALLARAPAAQPSVTAAPAQAGAVEWYPLGRLLAWIAMTAAGIVLIGSVALGGGDHARYHSRVSGLVEAVLRYGSQVPSEAPLPAVGGIESARLAGLIATILPTMAAAVFCLFLVVNAWLAARAVAISGRLARPWPPLPDTRMPKEAVIALLGSVAIGFGPGYLGVAGVATAGGLAMAFALQGLAFVHAVTAGRPGRPSLLICLYVLTVFFGGTILPMMAVVGMIDTASALRQRLLSRPGRKPD